MLAETHPEYKPPEPGEVFCHRHAELRFENVEDVHWTMSDSPSSFDATGEIDYGNIESFTFSDRRFELSGGAIGEWGSMVVVSSPPQLVFE